MPALKHATVSRSGVTVNHYNFETSKASVSATDDWLRFHFVMASKGGGNTDVQLEVGALDFPLVLKLIAASGPEARVWMARALATALADDFKKSVAAT